ncbi:aldehyde dehydrogenase [uncultured archaeon]|nr:aldehyde dehydrogenase [uncultured archaeon]
MSTRTVNPYSGETLEEYEEDNDSEIRRKISGLRKSQAEWGRDVDERIRYLEKELRPRLQNSRMKLAKLVSTEMGKPIQQSISEVDKCISLIDYGVSNYRKFLENEEVETEAEKSYIRFDPLGIVLLIMPWNFPLWQVMTAAVPAMAAGNAVILKHASIVSGTSLKLEEIFSSDLFKSSIVPGSRAIKLIRHADAVSFTGSTGVGAAIAEEAGRHIRKVVLELGGSDPFIVLKSADIDQAVEEATLGRLKNSGQSCTASKRFLVHEDVFEEFRRKVMERFASVEIGDPLKDRTFLGPLSSMQQTRLVLTQIEHLKSLGRVDMLGKPRGGIVPPTIAVPRRRFDEEIFGPVAIMKKFRDNDEAVRLANETDYGLGASIWGDPLEAEMMVPRIEAGMVFINRLVTSDPGLPFGGVKKSGIGREHSRYGLIEFANIKTVWVQ